MNWGAGQFGGIDLIARTSDWATQLGNITTTDPWLGADAYDGQWRHQALTVDPTLTTHHNMSTLMFHIWSGWWDPASQTGGLTNTVTFWVDNLYFEKNTNTAPVPPPTLSIKPATGGLQLLANQSGSRWQRQGIRTVESDLSWVGAPGPVTYELTIKEAPMKNGFQAPMFLIPNPVDTETAPDWGRPDDISIMIYDNGAGGGQINFGFKTNEANGNTQIYGANHLASLNSTKLLGTWKVTFNNHTDITMTAPDGGSTSFVMGAEAAAMFANPLKVYYGVMPGNPDYIGSGYVFSNVKATGVPHPIDDSFTTGVLDPLVWAKAADNPAGVLVAPPDAKVQCDLRQRGNLDDYGDGRNRRHQDRQHRQPDRGAVRSQAGRSAEETESAGRRSIPAPCSFTATRPAPPGAVARAASKTRAKTRTSGWTARVRFSPHGHETGSSYSFLTTIQRKLAVVAWPACLSADRSSGHRIADRDAHPALR